MVKVLTIRDPRTGTLIAEEPLQPKEDEDSALTRIYRKTLGPDAPEFAVMTRSDWLDDRKSAADMASNEGGRFGLVVLGPKEDTRREKSRLILAGVSEPASAAHMEFPMVKQDIEKVRRGRRRDAVVLIKPSETLRVGDTVKFYQVGYNPFGEVLVVPDGEAISVEVKEIRLLEDNWGGQHLYSIAWEPAKVTELPKNAPVRRAR